MDISFSSKEELYHRVKPALSAKEKEFKKIGFDYISKIDIWNCLIKSKWATSNNLMLCDIVSDIMHIEPAKIDEYLINKHKSSASDENLEVI